MVRENLSKFLLVSIIFNLILGATLVKKTEEFNRQTELTLYNYCRDTYYVYSDLDSKLFKNGSDVLNNSEYINNALSEAADRLITVKENIISLNIKDKRITKVIEEDKLSSTSLYILYLNRKLDKEKKLEEKDISNLKQIIDKGKLFGTYAESGPNYNKKFNPEHPLTKIANLYGELDQIYQTTLVTK